MLRRHFLHFTLAGTFAALWAAPLLAEETPKELRIGYQKNGPLLIAKQQRLLETRFEPLGITVKWVEFSFGPPLLEALNTNNIDYGTTGDAPPIFAQAAKANLLYVAALPAAGAGSAILLPEGSQLKTLADLKGKRIGFSKASSAHALTLAALEKAGLTYADITPVYLSPADGAAAFARGAIDAWTIWDPYYAIGERQKGARVLARADEIVAQNSYFLANREYTQKFPNIISAVNEELAKASLWAKTHHAEAAELFSQATGVDLEAQTRTVGRTEFVFAPVSDKVAGEQQAIADRFYKLGLIPNPVNVRDIVWHWTPNS
eukprot:gene15222-15367_t